MAIRCSPLVLLLVGIAAVLLPDVARPAEPSTLLSEEDYALYDSIVTNKFLTSDTRLVVLERMTTVRLIPDQDEKLTMALFQDQGYFNGDLPPELVRDFVLVNEHPVSLEGRFQFGVRYRFISGDTVEEPEVRSGFPVTTRPATQAHTAPVLDRLAFSRVGRTLRNDQALVYMDNRRPDGTGAGFLVWFRRHRLEWTIYDTEVVWTVRATDSDEGPRLAP